MILPAPGERSRAIIEFRRVSGTQMVSRRQRLAKRASIDVSSLLVILFALVSISLLPLLALSQETASKIKRHASEDSDTSLKQVEREIAANRFQESVSRLSLYLKEHPDSAKAHYDLGYVEFRTHNMGASIKELARSLELHPANAEAHKILALDCSIVGRYDLAETELIEAARLKPGSAEIHYFLARTYYTRGVYPLAKSEFQTAIRLDPSSVKAYSNLGITMEALGDGAEALNSYTHALDLNEKQPHPSEWPYIYLAAYYNRQKNAAQALAFARKAADLNPHADAAYFELAKAYRTQKELQQSAAAARRAIAINAQIPDYYYVLGLVLRELGNQKESSDALAKYSQLQQPAADASDHTVQEPLNAPEPQ